MPEITVTLLALTQRILSSIPRCIHVHQHAGDHRHNNGSHTPRILSCIPRCIHVQVYPSTARVVVQHLLFATKTNDNWKKIHLIVLTHNPDMFSLDSVHVQLIESFAVLVYFKGCDTAVFREARHRLFTTGSKLVAKMQTTRAALFQHVKQHY